MMKLIRWSVLILPFPFFDPMNHTLTCGSIKGLKNLDQGRLNDQQLVEFFKGKIRTKNALNQKVF